ncbi:PstS family phosphate ABC transporter substrate-binding protein [Chitinolyticbacter meiyuanensis]|uniref:PstS family phosphate ABC transporter substrate-binding protein n=1 Tax=Chitinolyticbacter meiyuanensis TaxID=682798 RepID=UPI0016523C90|nr:substrate-binding domain-containing protein [Chitinolyticbacter meiyuanensis]
MQFKLSNALLCALIAAPAVAANLDGGGATLPGIAYTNNNASSTRFSTSVPGPVGGQTPLFNAYNANQGATKTVSYCQNGSGNGKRVLNGTNPANTACSFNPAPTGFGAATVDANFVGSDSPISQSEYTTFITNKGVAKTEPAQFPAIGGAIALVYNKPGLATLNLTTAQVCGIFSGTITNWSALGGAAAPIKIVYRADGSGTTFGFSNFLSKVCNTPTKKFNTSQNFVGSPDGVLAAAPAGSISASGNGAVVTTIDTNANTIGYAEAANVGALANAKISRVNGQSPLTNYTGFNLLAADLLVDQVISGFNATTGRPNVVALSPAAPVPGCVLLVKPDAYAAVTTGYPIQAISYFLGYYKGNGAKTADLRTLLNSPFNAAIKAGTTTIGAGKGFVFLSGATASITTKINSCITN